MRFIQHFSNDKEKFYISPYVGFNLTRSKYISHQFPFMCQVHGRVGKAFRISVSELVQ